jgi:nitroreductase
MNWLDLIEQTQHCQRNWDLDKSLDQETIDWLFDVGYTMPTKQNLSSFQIVAFTDRTMIEYLTASAINKGWRSRHVKNPQMLAPVVYTFFGKTDEVEKSRSQEKRIGSGTTMIEIGLAAGAMALAANSVGLKTGFCKCFYPLESGIDKENQIRKALERYEIKETNISLALGVGYPIEGLASNIGNDDFRHGQFEKKPQTKIII